MRDKIENEQARPTYLQYVKSRLLLNRKMKNFLKMYYQILCLDI